MIYSRQEKTDGRTAVRWFAGAWPMTETT
jgi:hypothetical protein